MDAKPHSVRLPSLDGWRALSILLVLGGHCTYTAGFPPGLRDGFVAVFDGALGVRFFFCISGFLITYLMLQEADRTGRMSLRDFYVRRTLRILPVYFLFLAVLFGLQQFTPLKLSSAEWFSSLTFTVNFGSKQWVNGHLWSLAVEEQFYLCWPVVFALGGLAASRQRVLAVLAVPILVTPGLRVLCHLKLLPGAGWSCELLHALLVHVDVLAIGCVGAVIYKDHSETLRRWLCSRPGLVSGLAVSLIILPLVLQRHFLAGFFTVPLAVPCETLGFVTLMLQSVLLPGWGVYRVLNSAVACQLGVLSYSLYIWQQLFCAPPATYGLEQAWWLAFPGWLVPALGVAALSYYGFERPFLSLRARFRRVVPVA